MNELHHDNTYSVRTISDTEHKEADGLIILIYYFQMNMFDVCRLKIGIL